MKYGQLLFVIDEIPVQLGSIVEQVTEGDITVVADKLDHAARRVRAMASLYRSEFVGTVTAPRRSAVSSRRAA